MKVQAIGLLGTTLISLGLILTTTPLVYAWGPYPTSVCEMAERQIQAFGCPAAPCAGSFCEVLVYDRAVCSFNLLSSCSGSTGTRLGLLRKQGCNPGDNCLCTGPYSDTPIEVYNVDYCVTD